MGKRKEITGKDNGKQKMWIMITVIIVFFAMAETVCGRICGKAGCHT